MSKKKTKQLLMYALKPGMDKLEQLQAQLDMAVGLIISQKMLISTLRYKLKKNNISEDYEPEE